MKKILALILSTLMIASAFAGFAVSAEGEITPVVIYDGNKLDPNNGTYCVRGEYDYEAGCIRYTWFDQGIGIDPYFFLHHMDQGNLTVGDYMVIKYRTETEGLVGAAHIGNGGLGQSQAQWEYDDASGEWATAVVYLPDAIPGFYDADANTVTHIRFEVVESGQAENPDAWVDIEYIAFFDNEDDAYGYEHVLPAEPVDPNMAPDGSYATYDFTAADADLNKMLRVEGHNPDSYGNQMTAELVDGALRVTATGDDPYVILLHKAGTGLDTLGITGKQAKYILIKYKTEANSNTPMEFGFHTNGAGGLGWGPASNMIFPMVNNGEWNYALLDTSALIGSFGGELQAFRFDVLDKAAAGETIDIASIKFFGKDAKVQEYVMTLVETDVAAEKLAIAQGWVECEHENTVTLEAVEPTCTATGLTEGSACAVCGEILAAQETVDALGHDFSVEVEAAVAATCTEAGKTAVMQCSRCDATDGGDEVEALGHTEKTVPGTPATEEETGLTDGVVCDVCGETLVAQETIDKLPPEEEESSTTTEESTPATEESTPATEESAPATEESTPATDDETDAEETTTGEAEETTAPAAAETHAGDESTNAPKDAGCKGVIASASILAVAVMAAGVVVCKKKED